jgi:hypothetical protein
VFIKVTVIHKLPVLNTFSGYKQSIDPVTLSHSNNLLVFNTLHVSPQSIDSKRLASKVLRNKGLRSFWAKPQRLANCHSDGGLCGHYPLLNCHPDRREAERRARPERPWAFAHQRCMKTLSPAILSDESDRRGRSGEESKDPYTGRPVSNHVIFDRAKSKGTCGFLRRDGN